jgi:hypothetical protein|tara:strand:- start:1141 stop:1359 length:219 start_codon:yes stop_codon:yes gene_type:complete
MNNLYLYLPIPDRSSRAFGDQTYNTIWHSQQKTITEAIEATTEAYERGIVINEPEGTANNKRGIVIIDLYED